MDQVRQRNASIESFKRELAALKTKTETSVKWFYYIVQNKVDMDSRDIQAELVKAMNKCGLVVNTKYTGASLHMGMVVVHEGRFKYQHVFVSLNYQLYTQPFLKPVIYRTNIVFSRHAIERYLERMNSESVDRALTVMAKAVQQLNVDFVQSLEEDASEIPCGEHDRQVETVDGGMAIIRVQDISENLWEKMNWVVLTYISADMVKDFNRRYAELGFEGEWRNLRPSDFGLREDEEDILDALRNH
ncbi:hypothetical protein [Vibrio comitans]